MNKNHLPIIATLLITGALFTHAQMPQESTISSTMTSVQTYSASELKSANKVFAELNNINLVEIEFGNLAREKAEASAVRHYGEMLVTDHERIQDQVADAAELMGIQLVDKDQIMVGKTQAKLDKLNKMEGANFDIAFVQGMVEDHKQAIERLQIAQKGATGAGLQLVDQVLPALRQHLVAAEQLLVSLQSEKKPS